MAGFDRKLLGEQVAKLYFRKTGREVTKDIITAYYAEEARFQDPFFDVTGRDKVMTQFVAMWESFDEYELKSYTVDLLEDPKRLDVNSSAYYVIKGKPVTLDQCTEITMDDNGKVLFHHDVFKGSFSETLDTTPGLHEIFTGWRKLVGLVGDPVLKHKFLNEDEKK